MTTTSGGLQNITLQNGYQKLLVSYDAAGVGENMNVISTSVGDNLAGSVLNMGKNDTGHPALKIKATQANNVFFALEGRGTVGIALDGPMLSALSGDGMNDSTMNSVLRVHNILEIDTTATLNGSQDSGMGRGQIVFSHFESAPSIAGGNTSKVHGPTIFGKDGDVVFRMDGAAPTKHWVVDRLKIGSQIDEAAVTTFDCLATTANFKGIVTSDAMRPGDGLHVTGGKSSITSQDDVWVMGSLSDADSTIGLLDTPNIRLEARNDSGSAVLDLQSVQISGAGYQPVINIGTIDKITSQTRNYVWNQETEDFTSSTLDIDGCAQINLGTPNWGLGSTNYQKLTIASSMVKQNPKTVFTFPYWTSVTVAAAGNPRDTLMTEDNEASVWFYDDGTTDFSAAMRYHDGSVSPADNHEYVVDAVNHAVGRTTRCTAITVDPGDHTVGETLRYIWKVGSSYYDIIDFQYDATTRYIRHMKINDETTVAYTYASPSDALPTS